MKKFMKKLLFITLSCLLSFALIGCSDKNNRKNTKTSENTAKKAPEKTTQNNASADKNNAEKNVKKTSLAPTKEGTVLKLGDCYVDSNITVQVDSVSIEQKNIPALIKKIGPDKLDPQAKLSPETWSFMDSKGNAAVLRVTVQDGKEVREKEPYKDCRVVAVHCTLKNDTDAHAVINLYPMLYNYNGHKFTEYCWCHIENLEYKPLRASYGLAAHSEGEMTFLYAIGDPIDKKQAHLGWKIKDKPIYMGFHTSYNPDLDLEKGIYCDGKFLQIK